MKKINTLKILMATIIIALAIIIIVGDFFSKKETANKENAKTEEVKKEMFTATLKENDEMVVPVNDKKISLKYSVENYSEDVAQFRTHLSVNESQFTKEGSALNGYKVFVVKGTDDKEYLTLTTSYNTGGTGFDELLIFNDNGEKIYSFDYSDFSFDNCALLEFNGKSSILIEDNKIIYYEATDSNVEYTNEKYYVNVSEKEVIINNNTVTLKDNGTKKGEAALTCY